MVNSTGHGLRKRGGACVWTHHHVQTNKTRAWFGSSVPAANIKKSSISIAPQAQTKACTIALAICVPGRDESRARGGVGPTTVLDHSQVSSAGLDTRGAHHGHCSSKSELCLDRLLVVLTSRHPPARLLSSRHRVIETASNLIVDHVGPGRRCPKLQCW